MLSPTLTSCPIRNPAALLDAAQRGPDGRDTAGLSMLLVFHAGRSTNELLAAGNNSASAASCIPRPP